MVFPSEDESLTPMDFITKGSEVTCGIECKYIWLGAKGWGISWALKQCVVKPKTNENAEGLLQLDVESIRASSTPTNQPSAATAAKVEPVAMATAVKHSTYVEDSEEEDVVDKNEASSEEVKHSESVDDTTTDEPDAEEEKVAEVTEKPEKNNFFAPATAKKPVVKKSDDSSAAPKKVTRKKV